MLNYLDTVVDVCMYVSGENKESERSNKLIIVFVACRLNHPLDSNIDQNSDQLCMVVIMEIDINSFL